ncbi:leucyl-tRNA synthetase [Candidatus Uzinura diaspidicola str. ASNER]|uniref:leucine--tRNA ligase n=1 Tax=Candidatus Uzinura diaspidicola str. ASNER TaxID=1133592 RepID=L7VMS0_9FLAO|nr:leucyl-tRNA synthetase [Candidatus Uzinura diaspidicola str. ASNER]
MERNSILDISMTYTFKKIEQIWQDYWRISKIYEANNIYIKEKCYVLDMFPYPSGSGLHVGHTLGYIVSDIYARFKRSEGYNVLHPIGFDSFGLPTEQFAIQTGKHPIITTETNIKRYKKQLEELGFSLDWTREIRTSDSYYYRWTQWIFLQFLNSWYDKKLKKSRYIVELTKIFEREGNWKVKAFTVSKIKKFSNKAWKRFSINKKEEILQNFRLAYRSIAFVNWCKDLGTVLANDEVKDGRSERGGYLVYQKKMIQWNMRISAFTERLLSGLNKIEWPNALKEIQHHWIGKSYGAKLFFSIITHSFCLEVFTKQPYTIFEVSFIVLATASPVIKFIVTDRYKKEVEEYMQKIKNRNERLRRSKSHIFSGIFIGLYARNPFSKKEIPIYLSDSVLSSYGTGAVLVVLNSEGKCILPHYIKSSIKKIIEKGVGYGMINYRLRDVVFSRQRYWGEPIPIYLKKNGITENKLPLLLPEIDRYFPTKIGSTPLKKAKHWSWDEIKKEVVSNNLINKKNRYLIETSTMPAWAGSSWYMLRYMKQKINESFLEAEAEAYWTNVDLYIGGSEHATGHLIYARFWHLFLKDHQWINTDEPFKKLISQGMILGNSAFISKINDTQQFLSSGLIKNIQKVQKVPIDIHLLKNDNILDIEKFKNWRKEFYKADLITENGQFFCQRVVEKMSKSKFNVINPDKICAQFGADTLRIYEMFLGPVKQDKPWIDQGINGVHHFINKLWMLFHNKGNFVIEDSDFSPSLKEYKILHSITRKIREDMYFFSFNTAISAFMITINELSAIKCRKISILEPIVILIAPFAPHIAEELWHCMGYKNSVSFNPIPIYDGKYISEKTIQVSIMFDGKFSFQMHFSSEVKEKSIIDRVLNHPKMIQFSKINTFFKVIFIPYLGVNFIVSR